MKIKSREQVLVFCKVQLCLHTLPVLIKVIVRFLFKNIQLNLVFLINFDFNFLRYILLSKLIELISNPTLFSDVLFMPEVDWIGVINHFGHFIELLVITDKSWHTSLQLHDWSQNLFNAHILKVIFFLQVLLLFGWR